MFLSSEYIRMLSIGHRILTTFDSYLVCFPLLINDAYSSSCSATKCFAGWKVFFLSLSFAVGIVFLCPYLPHLILYLITSSFISFSHFRLIFFLPLSYFIFFLVSLSYDIGGSYGLAWCTLGGVNS